jgi:protein-disulfide isomerase
VASCLANGESDKAVDEGTRLAFLSGVRGTPTFVVDGFPMMGALPLDFMREMLNRRIASVAEGDTTR